MTRWPAIKCSVQSDAATQKRQASCAHDWEPVRAVLLDYIGVDAVFPYCSACIREFQLRYFQERPWLKESRGSKV